MPFVISKVHVEDFDRFIETFRTKGKDKRAAHGSRGVTVYRSSEDPSEVINVFDWDRDSIEEFMADPDTPELMKLAGLKHRPEFTFVERVTELDA